MTFKQLALIVTALSLSIPAARAAGSAGCEPEGAQESPTAAALKGYTADELKVIGYIADRLVAGEPPRFSSADIEEATGVSAETIETLSQLRLEQGLIAEMARRGNDAAAFAGNCAKFSACSIDRDLSGASAEEIERYEAEKSQDGETYEAWTAPGFTLERTTGDTVSLADYRGRSVAVAFLAGHCNHSMATLQMLAELAGKYEDKGLVILPVYINSGSADDIKGWSSSLGVHLPLLVAEGEDLSEAYRFRMVPTIFLIDREGQVRKKLVGQKDRETLEKAFGELTGTRVAAAND